VPLSRLTHGVVSKLGKSQRAVGNLGRREGLEILHKIMAVEEINGLTETEFLETGGGSALPTTLVIHL